MASASRQSSLSAAVIRLDRLNLPVFAIGVGVVHAIGLALLLPLLITLPGPGGDLDPKAAAVDVEIGPADPSASKVAPDGDRTSALPSSPQTGDVPRPDTAGSDAPAQPKDGASAVANVSPETSPSSMPAAAQEPAASASLSKKQQTKVEGKGAKPAKVTRAPAKNPLLAHAKTAKPPIRRPVKTHSKNIAPFKGSWSALLGAPTPSPSVKTQR